MAEITGADCPPGCSGHRLSRQSWWILTRRNNGWVPSSLLGRRASIATVLGVASLVVAIVTAYFAVADDRRWWPFTPVPSPQGTPSATVSDSPGPTPTPAGTTAPLTPTPTEAPQAETPEAPTIVPGPTLTVTTERTVGQFGSFTGSTHGVVVYEFLGDSDAPNRGGLATDIRLVDDRTIEIDIDGDVLFHDGTQLTVEDVAESLRRDLGLVDGAAVDVTDGTSVSVRLRSNLFDSTDAVRDRLGWQIPITKGGAATFLFPAGTGPLMVAGRPEPGMVELERFEGYRRIGAARPEFQRLVLLQREPEEGEQMVLDGLVDAALGTTGFASAPVWPPIEDTTSRRPIMVACGQMTGIGFPDDPPILACGAKGDIDLLATRFNP